MHADLAAALARLEADLAAGAIDRAALFWLKVYVEQALAGGGALRSDRWIEAGLAAGAEIPGLSPAQLEPRQQLIAGYGLFHFVRLKDDAQFSGAGLADLDWQRKYRVSLTPAFAASLAELAAWVEARWSRLGGVDPHYASLEAVLARPHPQPLSQGERGAGLPSPFGRGVGGEGAAFYALDPRSHLLEILHDAQEIFGGWLPRPAVERIALALNMPQAEVYGVTEFYDLFHTAPVGRKVIRVCQDAPCAAAGADALLAGLCHHLAVQPGETTADGRYTVEPVRCLGLCDRAPAALVNRTRYAPARPDAAGAMLMGPPPAPPLRIGGLVKVALANVGVVNPTSLADYRAQGGLAALRKALHEMTPAQVLQAVQESGLVGRGGAAYPTGLKWQHALDNPAPRYVICNADESEPGAFKDRVLMDGDPFRVVEGLMLACYAVGAARGFIYVRGEHRLGYERFSHALRQLEQAGWLGEKIQGRDWNLRLEVRRGAGAYVCGEETALMESIEGKRGFPRLRPPFPTTAGLWGRPTVINNVETLAKVPSIVMHGPRWYGDLGTSQSAGTKLFSVSGSVLRPGVYEVPFGVPLRHLIEDMAGGLPPGRRVQAILTGGAAGTFLTAEELDTPLTFEDFKRVGGTIGAGTVMVFDDSADLRDVLARIAAFFAHESCGKCYPCQMGTARQAEILARVAAGDIRPGDAATLVELGQVMTDTSICGLGQAASWAIVDANRRWPALLAASIPPDDPFIEFQTRPPAVL
jgi:NADH-quinone oxidoreductase subunit F